MQGKACVHIPCIPPMKHALDALEGADGETDAAVRMWLEAQAPAVTSYKSRLQACPLNYPKKSHA